MVRQHRRDEVSDPPMLGRGAIDYNLTGLGSRSFEQMTRALMVGTSAPE